MINEVGVRENIRREISNRGYGGNLTKFAKEKGLANSYLNEILNGKRRFNEDWLKKIAVALDVPLYRLFADEPLVPWREKEPEIKSRAAEAIATYKAPPETYEPVKLFNEMLSLGPGVELSQLVPDDFAPILKKMLPRGFSSPPDRIVAYRTGGISMRPTINDGSIIWIDRLDIMPREGEIYAFLLPDDSITVKRLIRIQDHRCIIDGDNQDKRDRERDELKPFPMILECPEEDTIIRGRVIWVLNRFVEKPIAKLKD